jgi:hypothetical protein
MYKLLTTSTDWTSPEHHREFHGSAEFAELLKSWQSSPTSITTDDLRFYKFRPDQRYRQVALQNDSHFKEAVTVLVTAKFSADWVPDAIEPLDHLSPQRPRKYVWDNAWMLFENAARRSEGGWVSDRAFEAWSAPEMETGEKSFLGIIRFLDFRTASQFLKFAEKEENSSTDASFGRLQRLATGGVYAEVVKMKSIGPLSG